MPRRTICFPLAYGWGVTPFNFNAGRRVAESTTNASDADATESATDTADPFEATSRAVSEATIESVTAAAYDPFEAQPAVYDPFDSAAPADAAAYFPESSTIAPQNELVFLQSPTNDANSTNEPNNAPLAQDVKQEAAADPCAGAADKPLCELGNQHRVAVGPVAEGLRGGVLGIPQCDGRAGRGDALLAGAVLLLGRHVPLLPPAVFRGDESGALRIRVLRVHPAGDFGGPFLRHGARAAVLHGRALPG